MAKTENDLEKLNKYLDEMKPWSAEESIRDTIIYYVIDGIRIASLMLTPFMPTVSKYVLDLFGIPVADKWLETMAVGKLNYPVNIPINMKPLFPRVDVKKYLSDVEKISVEQDRGRRNNKMDKKEEFLKEIIDYEDFAKLDLRIGKIVEADKHPNADKLLLLKVDLGEEEPRTILAGIAKWYKPEELIGKNIVVVANLKPRKMRGIYSEGMLLAATDSSGKPILISPIEDVNVGSKVK